MSPVVDRPPAPCGQGSWVAGTVEVCDGEVVYRDYVYDDFGAQVLPPVPGFPFNTSFTVPIGDPYGFLPPHGAQRWPDADANTTDLVAVRMARVGDDAVAVTAELNTLFDPATTRVVVAVDRDPGGGTGGGPWPGLVAEPLLGIPLTSAGWDELVELGAGDAATNTYAGTVALAGAGALRLHAVVARADGVVMNVAFRGTGESGFWWESDQATALQAGDISAFALDLDAADLDPSVTRRAATPTGAVLQRVYVSDHTLGEGVSAGVSGPGASPTSPVSGVGQAFTMLGRYQPYGFYLPAGPAPHGLQLLLHGLSENHSARLSLPGTDAGITATMGDANGRILAAPLGRGWRGWYSSYSERDVFDVASDIAANYPTDRDHWVISGYSMGGYGSFRLGALYPDLWASAVTWVAYMGDFFDGTPLAGLFGAPQDVGVVGNDLDLMPGLRNVPVAALHAAADQLVLVPQALATRSRLATLGLPSMHWLHLAAEHLTLALADDWQKEAAWSAPHRRVTDPARVGYVTEGRFVFPELGLVPDHAHWVWSVVPAAAGLAEVDARSYGCGSPVPVTEVRQHPVLVEPGLLLASLPQEVAVVGEVRAPAADRFELSATNVASLTIDTGAGLSGSCLGAGPVEYRVTTAGPLAVTLTDGRVLAFAAAGTYEGTLPAVGDLATGPAAPAPTSLPATGGAGGAAVLGAAALVAALALRRCA